MDLTWHATLENDYWLTPEERYRICKKAVKQEVAVVNIILDSPQITQITKNARVSFSDKLGIIGECKRILKNDNVSVCWYNYSLEQRLFLPELFQLLHFAGGTIGLFCGLSLISIVETVYWILNWAKSIIVAKPHKHNHSRRPSITINEL